MSSARRGGGGAYPLWIGLLALGAFGALWATREAPAPADPGDPAAASAASSDAAVASAASTPAKGPSVPELIWRVEGADPPTGQTLGACLRAAGWERLTAHGGGPHPISVTYARLVLPSVVTATADGIELRTPMAARRHHAFALHAAIAGCLPGTRLVDPTLGPLVEDRAAWPRPQRNAGTRIDLLVRLEAADSRLLVKGLGRLGLVDLAWKTPDTPTARRRLQQAAAMVLLRDDPGVTALPFGEATAALTPAPSLGERARWIDLPAAAAAPPTAAARPASAAPTRKRPARARPARPRSTRPRPTKTAPKPRPKAPTSRWRPDYF